MHFTLIVNNYLTNSSLKKHKEALTFGHSLTDQIGGQLDAGFTITAMFEDRWEEAYKTDEFFPSFITTRAVKQKI